MVVEVVGLPRPQVLGCHSCARISAVPLRLDHFYLTWRLEFRALPFCNCWWLRWPVQDQDVRCGSDVKSVARQLSYEQKRKMHLPHVLFEVHGRVYRVE